MLGTLHRFSSKRTASVLRADSSRFVSTWATLFPEKTNGANPGKVQNYVNGQWVDAKEHRVLPDPLNGEHFLRVPDTSVDEIHPFVASLKACPKSGLHNPFKRPERYLQYGDVSSRIAEEMRKPEVADFFAKWIQRTSPKSYAQAAGEVRVTRKFIENFNGDNVRFLARSFAHPGDHPGQMSRGFRFPFGPVAVIAPFNFPLEIPVLQLMGALYMGNKPVLHVDQRVAVVMDQFLRLALHCGLPATDVDFLNCRGPVMGELLQQAAPRSTLFTGSEKVGEQLAEQLRGKIFLEDAGFDWKILGPDVSDVEYVAWQSDQDAYACSGQKCSAQSILFMHDNWAQAGLVDKLRSYAARRKLADLTIGPVITWTTEAMLGHVRKVAQIPGARVLFGGRPLRDLTPEAARIPAVYGAIEPTAVFVPLEQLLQPAYFGLCTTEVFGPVQIVTQWSDGQLPRVLEALERMEKNLTAAVVSRDAQFINHVVANTVNGTTYVGIRARTTGAPQNHFFGPSGDPRGAGIGTPEAIRLVWSTHREVIEDVGPVPAAAAKAEELITS